MKTSIKRCTLALIMCGMAVGSMTAQTVIISQDFNSLSVGNYNPSITGWTFNNCCGTNHGVSGNGNVALKIDLSNSKSSKTNVGYAKTPTFNYTGNAYLTFSHAYTNKDKSGNLTVSISGGGSFENGQSSLSFNVNTYNATRFTPESIKIFGFTSNTKITFTVAGTVGHNIAIDDVKITSIDGITLLEGSDNSETLTAYNGFSAHVTTRQFKGGIWNTMCLPFNVDMATMESALGENQDIQLRTYSSYDATNNAMNFTPVTGSTVIPAGTPFLVWLNNDVTTPVFEWVTINNTPAKTITDNGASFVGTYNPVDLNTDGTHLFLTKTNTLAIPGTGKNRMNGMRAYISVPESLAPTIGNARIAFLDVPTAISAVKEQQPATAVYNLSGQKVDGVGAGPVPARLRKGLYIVNGKKVIKY